MRIWLRPLVVCLAIALQAQAQINIGQPGQMEILELFREHAKNYIKSLPNFLCLQVTDRYSSSRDGRDRKIDRLLVKLSYVEGRERYGLVSRNGKSTPADQLAGGSISSGEWDSMMSKLFAPSSQARFEWAGWTTLRGKRAAVFNYFIDSSHSSLSIISDNQMRIVASYRGEVVGDPDTGIIRRVSFEAVDIPSSFPVQETTEVLDYGEIQIGGNVYICPLNAELHMRAGARKTHNNIAFKDYKVFSADSMIKFSSADLSPIKTQPLVLR